MESKFKYLTLSDTQFGTSIESDKGGNDRADNFLKYLFEDYGVKSCKGRSFLPDFNFSKINYNNKIHTLPTKPFYCYCKRIIKSELNKNFYNIIAIPELPKNINDISLVTPDYKLHLLKDASQYIEKIKLKKYNKVYIQKYKPNITYKGSKLEIPVFRILVEVLKLTNN